MLKPFSFPKSVHDSRGVQGIYRATQGCISIYIYIWKMDGYINSHLLLFFLFLPPLRFYHSVQTFGVLSFHDTAHQGILDLHTPFVEALRERQESSSDGGRNYCELCLVACSRLCIHRTILMDIYMCTQIHVHTRLFL